MFFIFSHLTKTNYFIKVAPMPATTCSLNGGLLDQ